MMTLSLLSAGCHNYHEKAYYIEQFAASGGLQ